MADGKKKETSKKIDQEAIVQGVKDIKKKVGEVIDLDRIEHLLGNNRIEFKCEDKEYRVTRPTFQQKQEANEKRIEKFTELLSNPKFLLEADLIKMYKSRNVDIEGMNRQYETLEKQKNDYLFKLGKMLKEKKPDSELDVVRKEISKMYEDQQELSMKRAIYLDASIESQVTVFVYSYLTFLITEMKQDNDWKPAWDTYEKFIKSNEQLVNTTIFHASLVSKNELPIM